MINKIVTSSTEEDLQVLDEYSLNDKLDCQTIQEDFDILPYCNRKDFVLLNTYNGRQYVSIVVNSSVIEVYNNFNFSYNIELHYSLLEQVRGVIINRLTINRTEVEAIKFLDNLIRLSKAQELTDE